MIFINRDRNNKLRFVSEDDRLKVTIKRLLQTYLVLGLSIN